MPAACVCCRDKEVNTKLPILLFSSGLTEVVALGNLEDSKADCCLVSKVRRLWSYCDGVWLVSAVGVVLVFKYCIGRLFSSEFKFAQPRNISKALSGCPRKPIKDDYKGHICSSVCWRVSLYFMTLIWIAWWYQVCCFLLHGLTLTLSWFVLKMWQVMGQCGWNTL